MTAQHSNGVNGSSLHEQLGNVHINGHDAPNGTNGLGNGIQARKMDRKKSSPMMPAFMVSAPGKVIVFGEHAVVHGKVRQVSSSSFARWLTDFFFR